MFPPYLFAYTETLKAEPAVADLMALAQRQGAALWITGGTLRDVLLTRWPRDLDLAVDGDAIRLGKSLAGKMRGAFVPLDDDTCRVVIQSNQGIDWIDLVNLRGPTIHDDLSRRDFTVNAIALSLEEALAGSGDLLDPTGGRDDLHKQCIRMAGPTALADDPLRIVRAYRFAAQLGFAIGEDTRGAIRKAAKTVTRPAPERICQELSHLLESPAPAEPLAAMMADGVLEQLIPELAAERGVTQNAHHHLDVWEHTVETLRQLADIAASPADHGLENTAQWLIRSGNKPNNRTVLSWAALFHDVGKPPCRTEEEGRVRFIGHEKAGAALFATVGRRLRLPGKVIRRVERLIRHHLRPLLLAPEMADGGPSGKAVDRLYRDLGGGLGDDLPALFLLAMADSLATRGPDKAEGTERDIAALYAFAERFHAETIRELDAAPPLLTGRDLITRHGVPEGPRVGRLLVALRHAQLAGEVKTRAQAEAWLARQLAGHGAE